MLCKGRELRKAACLLASDNEIASVICDIAQSSHTVTNGCHHLASSQRLLDHSDDLAVVDPIPHDTETIHDEDSIKLSPVNVDDACCGVHSCHDKVCNATQ